MAKITIKDISEALQLSVHTVSKALRGLPGMSDETRFLVHQKAKELGYRTKAQKQSLAIERISPFPYTPMRFMLVITRDNGQSDLNQMLLAGLQEKLTEFGHSVETVIAPEAFTDDASFVEWTEKHHISYASGIFIPPFTSESLEQQLLSLPMPRILLNFPPHAAQVDSVVWDVEAAIHQAVQHLAALGHSRILYIGDRTTHRGLRLRWAAFQAAMESNLNIRVHEADHHTERNYDQEQWMEQLTSLIQHKQPTAILSGVGGKLPSIYLACTKLGIRIPEDCSVVAVEHGPSEFVPQLTRPTLPIKEAGIRGAERMLWRQANQHLPYEHTKLQGVLLVQGTTLALAIR